MSSDNKYAVEIKEQKRKNKLAYRKRKKNNTKETYLEGNDINLFLESKETKVDIFTLLKVIKNKTSLETYRFFLLLKSLHTYPSIHNYKSRTKEFSKIFNLSIFCIRKNIKNLIEEGYASIDEKENLNLIGYEKVKNLHNNKHIINEKVSLKNLINKHFLSALALRCLADRKKWACINNAIKKGILGNNHKSNVLYLTKSNETEINNNNNVELEETKKIKAISDIQFNITLTEIADKFDIDKSTASRLCRKLEKEKFIKIKEQFSYIGRANKNTLGFKQQGEVNKKTKDKIVFEQCPNVIYFDKKLLNNSCNPFAKPNSHFIKYADGVIKKKEKERTELYKFPFDKKRSHFHKISTFNKETGEVYRAISFFTFNGISLRNIDLSTLKIEGYINTSTSQLYSEQYTISEKFNSNYLADRLDIKRNVSSSNEERLIRNYNRNISKDGSFFYRKVKREFVEAKRVNSLRTIGLEIKKLIKFSDNFERIKKDVLIETWNSTSPFEVINQIANYLSQEVKALRIYNVREVLSRINTLYYLPKSKSTKKEESNPSPRLEATSSIVTKRIKALRELPNEYFNTNAIPEYSPKVK